MDFEYVKATEADVPGIMRVMNDAVANMEKAEWFISDDEAFIRRHLKDEGFILVAKDGETVAGFFLARIPGLNGDNMGRDIGFDDEKLMKSAHMESAAVLPEYRGNGVQKKLVGWGCEILRDRGFHYLFSTVHPDNAASMKSMMANGFTVKKTKLKYGKLLRNIMYREI